MGRIPGTVALLVGTFLVLCSAAHAVSRPYFDGIEWAYSGSHSNAGGARADLRDYLPRCSNYDSDTRTSAWVMIDRAHSADLAQIGYARWPHEWGNSVYVFYEYEEGGGYGAATLGQLPSPSGHGSHRWTVIYDASDGKLHFNEDGVVKALITPSWEANDVCFDGEVWRSADGSYYPQMPGDTSWQVYYEDTSSSIQVYYSDKAEWITVHQNSGNWGWAGWDQSYVGYNNSDPNASHSVNSDDTWFRIWDTRYSSQGS